MNILILFVIMIVANIVLLALSYTCKTGPICEFVKHRLSHFKYNAYISFCILAFFDLTFFSIMKILDGNNSTTTRKIATFFSYTFFVSSIIYLSSSWPCYLSCDHHEAQSDGKVTDECHLF